VNQRQKIPAFPEQSLFDETKKLMNYEDVAVQFNQIIDRDFPQYNADTLSDTLMKKINFPILPNEEERKYFLYCISRVLAGKYED